MPPTSRHLAEAKDVQINEVYHPAQRPGYACWTALWHDLEGTLYLAFAEKRRAPNTLWAPVPLDFWESMGLPIHYHTSFCNGSRDVLTELVVLRSEDDGTTWTESGRSPSKVINAFAWSSLPDGGIIRAVSDDYVAFDPVYKPQLRVEVSDDGGSSWRVRAVVLEGFQTYAYCLDRLEDGTYVLVAPYQEAFGPGRARQARHTVRPHAHRELEYTTGVFFSRDEGRSWSGPQTAFPGELVSEPDFVELPSGDLLFVYAETGAAPGVQLRQKFIKVAHGFVPGPVFEVVCGWAPERFVRTRSGLLVGAQRGAVYSCSNDEGASWHQIHGAPDCNYQPRTVELADGRLLTSWHIGGDNFFGELDQWVGTHVFRLEVDLPEPTMLALARTLNNAGSRYTNIYEVTLTQGSLPLPDRTVHFAFHRARPVPGDYNKARDPREAGTRRTAVTDDAGRARLDLSEYEKAPDTPNPHVFDTGQMHMHYRVTAWFEPDPADPAVPACRSEVYSAYPLNMSKAELGHPDA
jgi:hypothetical protein